MDSTNTLINMSALQGNIVMLVRCHGKEAEDDGSDEGSEWLLKGLTHQCSLTLHVQGLPTGYCRDIHGQVCVYVDANFLIQTEHTRDTDLLIIQVFRFS